MSVPEHVAIIMDGNGRWAKAKGMPRNYGHVQGAKTVEDMCEIAWNMGIKYLTVYAFSTENWSRPKDEVNALMKLLRNYMKNCIKRASANNMRVRVIGDKTGLDEDIRKSIADLEEATKGYTGLNFTIAINYGGRDEITRAVRSLAKDVENGTLKPEDITDKMISERLDTGDLPDPDLLIRTCGELRVSNFLLWQISYSEIYVTDVAWPDFNEAELKKACDAYEGRTRKFGNVAK
ncbi:MAG: isoprenyl transferase [Lachnospiraceae bacterium]|nr:isoprenyl transferase [Lachnospiraceae bacterium]